MGRRRLPINSQLKLSHYTRSHPACFIGDDLPRKVKSSLCVWTRKQGEGYVCARGPRTPARGRLDALPIPTRFVPIALSLKRCFKFNLEVLNRNPNWRRTFPTQ